MLKLNDLSIIMSNHYKTEVLFTIKGAKDETKEHKGTLITKYSNPESYKVMVGLGEDKDTGIKQVAIINPAWVKELTVTLPVDHKTPFNIKLLEAVLSPAKVKFTIQ